MNMNKPLPAPGLFALAVCIVLLFWSPLSAQQQTVDFFIEDVQTTIDDEVSVDVTVGNFQNIAGVTFSMAWDSTALNFTGLENLITDTDEMNNFNTMFASSGKIGYSLVDMSLTGYDYPDGTRLFTIKFEITGADNSVYDLRFGNDPTGQVVADTLAASLPASFNDGTITVGNPTSVSSPISGDPRFTLSPNPFFGTAQLRINELGAGAAKLDIYTLAGRLVGSRTLRLSDQQNVFPLLGDDLPETGVYLLQLTTDRGVYSRKIVYQGGSR